MKLLAKFHDTEDGGYSRVYQLDPSGGYLVQYFDSFDRHMDGSDYQTNNLSDAINNAGEEHPMVVRQI